MIEAPLDSLTLSSPEASMKSSDRVFVIDKP